MVNKKKEQVAGAICHIFMALLYKDTLKEGSPWQLLIEEDARRYILPSFRLKVGSMSPTDPKHEEIMGIWETERQRVFQYCINNHISCDIIKIQRIVETSFNKGVIYWGGENEVPVLFFKSSAYNDVDTLYLFKPMEHDVLFNSVQIMPDNQPCYKNVGNKEALSVLVGLTEMDVKLYETHSNSSTIKV
jgi:hypothetical protein